jgi:hypothetical protein
MRTNHLLRGELYANFEVLSRRLGVEWFAKFVGCFVLPSLSWREMSILCLVKHNSIETSHPTPLYVVMLWWQKLICLYVA